MINGHVSELYFGKSGVGVRVENEVQECGKHGVLEALR